MNPGSGKRYNAGKSNVQDYNQRKRSVGHQRESRQEPAPKKVDRKGSEQILRVIGGVEKNPGPLTHDIPPESEEGEKKQANIGHQQGEYTR